MDIVISINNTNKKWIMHIYKDSKLKHSYVNTLSNLLNMCLVFLDICEDTDELTIYKNKKVYYASGKRILSIGS